MSLDDEAGIVAPPVAACPTRALIQEFDVVLKGGLNLTLGVVLNPGLPLVRHQPSGNEVVIVSIQLVLTPTFSLETIQEQGTLEDFGSEGTGASGHAGGSTIDSMSGRDFKVASFDIGSSEPIVAKGLGRSRANAFDSLIGTNSANFTVFEWGEEPR